MNERKRILPGLFQGKYLVMLAVHWKLVLYVFALIMLYITLHYRVDDTSMIIIRNNQVLKELKTDYTTRHSEYHELTTIKETTKLLEKLDSPLQPPQTPPITITEETAAY